MAKKAKAKRRRKMHYRHPKHYLHKNGLTKAKPAEAAQTASLALSSATPPPDPWIHRSTGLRCSTCMWFAEKGLELGRCRRRAPSPDGSIGWPVVYRSDWCGQHKLDETKI